MLDIIINPSTKSATVITLLKRVKTAALDDISEVIKWQAHDAHAFMARVRQKRFVILRDKDAAGGSICRITDKTSLRQKSKIA